jgi:hypothetical protein
MESEHSGWMTRERRNWLALVVLSLAVGFAFGNGHTTQNAVQDISQQLGKKGKELDKAKVEAVLAKDNAYCQRKRAEQAQVLTVQAVVSVKTKTVPLPSIDDIPECPEPKR